MDGVLLPAVGRIVTPDGIVNGTLIVDGDRFEGILEREGEPTGWVLPGFVDVHCHGGGGFSLANGDPESARGAAAFHASRGTTTLVASLVSSTHGFLLDATRALKPLVADGTLAGVHYEGPYISAAKCGAHRVEVLRDPDLSELTELIEAGGGAVKMVTIAPELNGALEAIEFLDQRGVVPAIGHTNASYEQTAAGIDAGAQAATHLFNAMRAFNHREPGPIPALLDDERIFSEIVADPVHLHPGTMRFAFDTSLPAWTLLVSDAMDAAGLDDGRYMLGRHEVEVLDGVATVAGTDIIAGSTITLLDAFRNAVRLAGQSVEAASQMASATPAELLGLGDVGAIETGKYADAVVLDDDFNLVSAAAPANRAGTAARATSTSSARSAPTSSTTSPS
ncbi:N-acetylglucosamine-6-phosphate deacetylase, partial [Glycomyces lechevalierae]